MSGEARRACSRRAARRPCARAPRGASDNARRARPRCARAARRAIAALPGGERPAHAGGREVQPLQLADEPAELAHVPALGRRTFRRRNERREDPLARERIDACGCEAGTTGHLLAQVREARDASAHDDPGARQLLAIVADVRAARHHQPRSAVAPQLGAQTVEDELRLARVRGTRDERERHRCMVALASDICLRTPPTSVHGRPRTCSFSASRATTTGVGTKPQTAGNGDEGSSATTEEEPLLARLL